MESSGSRKLAISQPDLLARPSLKFIQRMVQMLNEDTIITKEIATIVNDTDKTKEVLANMRLFSKAILEMDQKFLEYEKTHEPIVDIKYKQKVSDKQKKAKELAKSMKKVPSEHERKTSELDDKIKELRVDKRDIGRNRLVAEVTGIHIDADEAMDAHRLERDKRILQKKINKLCCLCIGSNADKLEQYNEQLRQIKVKIAAANAAAQHDKEENKNDRQSKEERIQELDRNIDEIRRQRSQHIEVSLEVKIKNVEEVYAKAEESLERAKADLRDAEQRSLRDIGRTQMADLLFLLAQFLKYKQSVDGLYMKQREILKSSVDDARDSIDSLMKKIKEFKDKLESDQNMLEDMFFKFLCSEAALRTGRAIYHKYHSMQDQQKQEFTLNSFVDTAILGSIIELASPNVSPDVLPRLSNHTSTFHSKHARKKTDTSLVSTENLNAHSSSTSTSSSSSRSSK